MSTPSSALDKRRPEVQLAEVRLHHQSSRPATTVHAPSHGSRVPFLAASPRPPQSLDNGQLRREEKSPLVGRGSNPTTSSHAPGPVDPVSTGTSSRSPENARKRRRDSISDTECAEEPDVNGESVSSSVAHDDTAEQRAELERHEGAVFRCRCVAIWIHWVGSISVFGIDEIKQINSCIEIEDQGSSQTCA